MKIIIESREVKKGAEIALPQNTVIRYEIGSVELRCKLTEDGLAIYKVNENPYSPESGLYLPEEDAIMAIGAASNKMYIK